MKHDMKQPNVVVCLCDQLRAFIETDSWQIGIRTTRHLYGMALDPETRAVANGRLYFFDIKEYPLQSRNLADTAEAPDVAAGLRERLKAWDRTAPWRAGDAGAAE